MSEVPLYLEDGTTEDLAEEAVEVGGEVRT